MICKHDVDVIYP